MTTDLSPADTISSMITRLTEIENVDRATCAVMLLNTFITARQRVAGQVMFDMPSFYAFLDALMQLEKITNPDIRPGANA